MANAEKLFERMRADPFDWRIDDVIAVCEGFGIACSPPRGGSHYKIRRHGSADILTVPARRPIKPVYIRQLVRFIDAREGEAS